MIFREWMGAAPSKVGLFLVLGTGVPVSRRTPAFGWVTPERASCIKRTCFEPWACLDRGMQLTQKGHPVDVSRERSKPGPCGRNGITSHGSFQTLGAARRKRTSSFETSVPVICSFSSYDNDSQVDLIYKSLSFYSQILLKVS